MKMISKAKEFYQIFAVFASVVESVAVVLVVEVG